MSNLSLLFCSQEGGEVYFSDIYADRKMSEDIRKHEVLWGMYDWCKEGALGAFAPYFW